MGIDIDINKTALALLHFQKDICEADGLMAPSEPEALARFDATIANTESVLKAARKVGIPIIYSAFGRPSDGALANRFGGLFRWIAESGGCVEGQAGYEFTDTLAPKNIDVITRSSGISAFTGSTFGNELARFGIQTILVAGITTHWAVEGTVRDAADSGYDCVVLADCSASANETTHDGAIERLGFIARVSDSTEVIKAFDQ